MVKEFVGFPSKCENPGCHRKIGDLEMAFARPMNEGKMCCVCSKCCKEWDRENYDSHLKNYLQNIIIPQMNKDKKERDERYDREMAELGVKKDD